MILWLMLACATPSGTPAVPVSPAPVAPPQPPQTAQDCVAQCQRNNMARAVDHAVIKADCQRACSGEQEPTLQLTDPQQ